MSEVLVAVAVIAGLSALLAVILLAAEALVVSYGECLITINDEEEHSVEGGKTLLSALMDEQIFVPSACGGRGSCGLCKVKALEGAGPILPTERPHLSDEEIEQQVRLSCQVKVRGDMRLALPEEILSLQQYATRVAELRDLNYDTRFVRLELVEPPEIEFVPGQYIQLETPAYGKTPEPVYRAYSVASPRSQKGAVELIIRLAPGGICTTYVFELMEEGDEATINGPYGDFYLRESDREMVFIAGGSGIAPIRSILFQMAREQIARKATLFYGANEMRDFYLQDELRGFEQSIPDFTYVPSLARPQPDDRWEGETGLVTEAMYRHVQDASDKEFYLCGSPAMIDAALEMLQPKGLVEEHVFYDKFLE